MKRKLHIAPFALLVLTAAVLQGRTALGQEPAPPTAEPAPAAKPADPPVEKPGAEITEITPLTRGDVAGFRVAYSAPNADGAPQSYPNAHFGIAPDWFPPPSVQPIWFTEMPPEALHVAPWNFQDASVQGALMTFHVGYSGCSPEHPFSLWMSGEFMESQPPRAVVTLVNELDEECDAAFEQRPVFDLGPLYRRYVAAYGPGELILDLRGPDGFSQLMKIGIAMPDSTDPDYPGGS